MTQSDVHDGRSPGAPAAGGRASPDPATSAAPAGPPLTILSLNYHEATSDPRVFKQARAMAKRGHRVVILCRWLKDYPKAETVEGVEIVRFDCFARTGASDLDPKLFPFLTTSRALVEARYAPYAASVSRLDALAHARDWAEARVAETEAAADGPDAASPDTGPVSDGIGDLHETEESFGRAAVMLTARINELRAIYRDLDAALKSGTTSEAGMPELKQRRNAAHARLSEWVETRETMKRQRAEVKEILTRLETEAPEIHADMAERARARRTAGHERRSARNARSWITRDFNAQRRVVNEMFGELYQVQSIPFAVNLMREKMPCIPDIVHAHDFYTLPAAIHLAGTTGARVLYDAHEFEPGRATKMPPEGRALIDAMERDCLRPVDRMTTVSPAIADLYADRFPKGPPDLILNVPEIDMAEFGARTRRKAPLWSAFLGRSGPAGRLRKMTGLPATRTLIVFTGGSQREHRGLDKLCLALSHLPDHHFVAMGPRVPNDDAWLMEHADRAGVADRVHLLPPVPPGEIVATIADADLAICPIQDVGISYRFALPNKLFEAAFARLPIVVSDLPEMRRFVEELGIGQATDQTDPGRIADTIREVLADRDRYVLTSAAARTLATTYSWEAQEERLAGIIREMGPRRNPVRDP